MLGTRNLKQGNDLMEIDLSEWREASFEQEARKSFSARVFPNGHIAIKAPLEASAEEVQSFIARKRHWIKTQLNFFEQFKTSENKVYQNGCTMFYLGRQYQLIVQKKCSETSVRLEKNKIVVRCEECLSDEMLKKILGKWLAYRRERVFRERLEKVCRSFFDFEQPSLKIRKLKRRWGSYLKNHTIILNPELIYASKSAIDCIIVHELCHFYYKNHNAAFYDLLTSKMPNWKKIEIALEQKLLGRF